MEDFKIVVYEAKKRTDTKWQEKIYSIEGFAKKLASPVIGKETQAEYFNLSKEEQNELKDVGGFTGSILEGGKRNKNSIKAKTLITLDIDNAPADIIDKIKQVYKSFYFFIYTTRKHKTEAPRLRLLFLITKHIDTVQYEAVARKMAAFLGLSYFDATTFQPSRFMYWASTSKDAPFVFYENKGNILDPDTVLKLYKNYRHINEWPLFEEEQKQQKKLFKDLELEDQLLKPGLVGIYNRNHTISSLLLNELADKYEPSKMWENVFTYKGASSVDGVKVLKNDTIYYSFHSSDPNQGEAINAFDLMRRVKFGHLDEGVSLKTNMKYYPSYKAMCEYVEKDQACQGELDLLYEEESEKVQEQKGKSSYTDNILNARKEYAAKCLKNQKGACIVNPYNLNLLLRTDKNVKNLGHYDVFYSAYIKNLDLPWLRTYKKNNFEISAQWQETDTTYLQQYINKYYALSYSNNEIERAVRVIIQENQKNTVYEYFKGLKWDKVPRLKYLLVDYLGAENSDEIHEITVNHFVASVARVCQFREDEKEGVYYPYCLCLIGSQGLGKTSLLKRLVYKNAFYIDLQTKLDEKNTLETLKGKWIVELGESSSLTKSEAGIVKQAISKTADEYRKAYGRDVELIKRRFVFFLTANTFNILNDITGNRRFLFVEGSKERQKKEGYKMEEAERDQIWAEAFHYYMSGHDYNHFNRTTQDYLEEQQERANKKPDYMEEILEFCARKVPADFYEWGIADRRLFYNVREDDFFNSQANEIRTYTPSGTRITKRHGQDWKKEAFYRERISTFEFINEYLGVDINDNFTLRNFQKREIKKAFRYLSNFEKDFIYFYDEKGRYENSKNAIKYPREEGVLKLKLEK